MRTTLMLAILMAALTAPALADVRHDSPQELQLRAAERQEVADSQKQQDEAEQTMIAERDLDSARLRIAVTNEAWQRALQMKHAGEAGTWAKEHYEAQVAERDAEGRYEVHRAGRDLALADFQRDAHLVHMCEQRLRKLSARR